MRRFSALVRYVSMRCDRAMWIVCVIRVVSCRVVLICVVFVTLRVVRFGSVWFGLVLRIVSCWVVLDWIGSGGSVPCSYESNWIGIGLGWIGIGLVRFGSYA